MKIFDRIPNRKYLYPVYGLIVMPVYGWSLYHFFWNLPGWLKILTLNEIGAVLAYTFVTDLAESLLILAGLIGVSIILPLKWFHDDFVVRGGLSVLFFSAFIMVLVFNSIPFDQLNNYVKGGLLHFAFLHFIIGYVHPLRKIIDVLADRSTVFLYLSIPSSVLALIIVLIRNVLGVV